MSKIVLGQLTFESPHEGGFPNLGDGEIDQSLQTIGDDVNLDGGFHQAPYIGPSNTQLQDALENAKGVVPSRFTKALTIISMVIGFMTALGVNISEAVRPVAQNVVEWEVKYIVGMVFALGCIGFGLWKWNQSSERAKEVNIEKLKAASGTGNGGK